MKKCIVLLLIVVVFCFMGCSKEKDMSSLSEYEMVEKESNYTNILLLTLRSILIYGWLNEKKKALNVNIYL